MTRVTQRLQVTKVQRCSALVDRSDVVDHCRWYGASSPQALFAQGIPLELDFAESPPRPALVELGVVMCKPLEGLVLRHPRTMLCFLDGRHGGIIVLGSRL